MRIQLLDNITGKWALQWIVTWFIAGVIALSAGFWLTTEHTGLDWFYLGVSFIGLVCVVSLSFRKNVLGNGFGMGATPTAIANMQAVTDRYLASPKAFLIVPMVGAFFVDIINATVLQIFIKLPFM